MVFHTQLSSTPARGLVTEFLRRRYQDVFPATDVHPARLDAHAIQILLTCFISVYTITVVQVLNYQHFALNNQLQYNEWKNGKMAKTEGSLESGGRTAPSSNGNSLPHHFSTGGLNSPPSACRYMSLPVFPVREQRYMLCH